MKFLITQSNQLPLNVIYMNSSRKLETRLINSKYETFGPNNTYDEKDDLMHVKFK